MSTTDEYEAIYEEITEMNYDVFFEDADFEVDWDEYLLKIDITYRIEFGVFPIVDPEIEIRLDPICERIAYEYIREDMILNNLMDSMEECEEEEEEPDEDEFDEIDYEVLKEQLLDYMELFLEQKGKAHEQEYPQNRRFKRKDFWVMQKLEFMHGTIETPDAYMEVFESLVKEGYYDMVETGGDRKHDIFHAKEV